MYNTVHSRSNVIHREIAMSITINLYAEYLRFRGFDPLQSHTSKTAAADMPETSSSWATTKRVAKNLLVAAVGLTRIALSVYTLIEIISLGAIYLYSLLFVGAVSLIFPSFRKFMADTINNIYAIASNNVSILALLATPLLAVSGLRLLFGLGKGSTLLLNVVAEAEFVESALSVVLGLAATVATAFPDHLNTFLESIGFISPTPAKATADDVAADNSKEAWSIGGALVAIISAARLQPNLLFGIAATSIVSGIGATLGRWFAGTDETANNATSAANYDVPMAIAVEQPAASKSNPMPSAPPAPGFYDRGFIYNTPTSTQREEPAYSTTWPYYPAYFTRWPSYAGSGRTTNFNFATGGSVVNSGNNSWFGSTNQTTNNAATNGSVVNSGNSSWFGSTNQTTNNTATRANAPKAVKPTPTTDNGGWSQQKTVSLRTLLGLG